MEDDHRLAIEVKDLECGYGETPVLRDVSFSVKEGEIFFIVGGNGSGKSTLLRNLVGLMDPIRGSVSYFGRAFTKGTRHARRDILRSIGILYQNDALWSSMTVRENIEVPLEEHTDLSRTERNRVASLKLMQVGLRGYGDHSPEELSGGMRKRAALARALVLDPSVVFFDEPSAGLDPISAGELEELILQTRETMGTTIVIVSHKLADIYGMADRLILLDSESRGIRARGSARELAREHEDASVRRFLTARLVEDAPRRPRQGVDGGGTRP